MPGAMPGNMSPEKMREFMQNLTPEQREAMRTMRGAGRPGQGRPGTAGADSAGATQRVVIQRQ